MFDRRQVVPALCREEACCGVLLEPRVYRELIQMGYPGGYRVLCFNCNLARAAYGYCPHENGGPTGQPELDPTLQAIDVAGDRECTRCHRGLADSAFYSDELGRGGLQSRCRACTREASSLRLRALRLEALVHYGACDVRCRCCGEREEKFLALDHIDGGGPRQPGRRAGGNIFHAWLKKQGFPPGLQVLCHNCNCAKGRDRLCPHVLAAAA